MTGEHFTNPHLLSQPEGETVVLSADVVRVGKRFGNLELGGRGGSYQNDASGTP